MELNDAFCSDKSFLSTPYAGFPEILILRPFGFKCPVGGTPLVVVPPLVSL